MRDSAAGERPDSFCLIWPFGGEFLVSGVVVIGEVEAGYDRASQQCQLSLSDEPCALPDAGRNQNLNVLAGRQIGSQGQDRGIAARKQLEHLDRIAEVEVEHLVGVEEMELRESSGLEEVVDGGALGAGAAGQFDVRG